MGYHICSPDVPDFRISVLFILNDYWPLDVPGGFLKQQTTMQNTGYIIVHGQKILVLSRFVIRKDRSGYRSLKIRRSGVDGQFFDGESLFLEERDELVDSLIKGNVIYL